MNASFTICALAANVGGKSKTSINEAQQCGIVASFYILAEQSVTTFVKNRVPIQLLQCKRKKTIRSPLYYYISFYSRESETPTSISESPHEAFSEPSFFARREEHSLESVKGAQQQGSKYDEKSPPSWQKSIFQKNKKSMQRHRKPQK